MLRTIDPEFLAMPERVLEIMPPRLRVLGPIRSPMRGAPSVTNRDVFPGRTGHPFDPLGAAETAANYTVERLRARAEGKVETRKDWLTPV